MTKRSAASNPSSKARSVKQRAEADARELAWWRSQFATRFTDGSLPKVGSALTAKRFTLFEVLPEGRLRSMAPLPWTLRRRRPA